MFGFIFIFYCGVCFRSNIVNTNKSISQKETQTFFKSANCPIVYIQLDKLHRTYQLTFIVCSLTVTQKHPYAYYMMYNTLPYKKKAK